MEVWTLLLIVFLLVIVVGGGIALFKLTRLVFDALEKYNKGG